MAESAQLLPLKAAVLSSPLLKASTKSCSSSGLAPAYRPGYAPRQSTRQLLVFTSQYRHETTVLAGSAYGKSDVLHSGRCGRRVHQLSTHLDPHVGNMLRERRSHQLQRLRARRLPDKEQKAKRRTKRSRGTNTTHIGIKSVLS